MDKAPLAGVVDHGRITQLEHGSTLMYHPHRIVIAPFAAALLLAFPVSAAWSQTALPPAAASAVKAPDPVYFRIRMEMGDIDRAREWLDGGVDPNLQGDRIGSGLMIAAWNGNIPLMELFAAHGADINRANKLGETALMHAAWQGQIEAVRWLLAHGARVGRGPLQWSALHYAVFAGHGDIAALLLDQGADIDARSPNGSSVLMMAVYEGHDDLARRLVERGADTTVKNENGDGALQWALKFDRPQIARIVATREEFKVAASKPKAEFGPVRKSERIPKELEDLLNVREILAQRHLSVDKIDSQIAAARAKYARASLKRNAPPAAAAVLEISAERKAPQRQRVRMVGDAQKK